MQFVFVFTVHRSVPVLWQLHSLFFNQSFLGCCQLVLRQYYLLTSYDLLYLLEIYLAKIFVKYFLPKVIFLSVTVFYRSVLCLLNNSLISDSTNFPAYLVMESFKLSNRNSLRTFSERLLTFKAISSGRISTMEANFSFCEIIHLTAKTTCNCKDYSLGNCPLKGGIKAEYVQLQLVCVITPTGLSRDQL